MNAVPSRLSDARTTTTPVNGLLQGSVIPTVDKISVTSILVGSPVEKLMLKLLAWPPIVAKVAKEPVYLQDNARYAKEWDMGPVVLGKQGSYNIGKAFSRSEPEYH
ncbi:uncharacterized protein ARMOST_11888 [Armillaria ostoyae]|uniref:Uncharacterized protein n=1 Tax=Armillaria ostoyae TaxID=47428 RepID=A0A284RIF1_ARMOS|nr:uncharacterized protein ARMOST_11888 [Armillaria ostoyae]